MDNGHKFSAAIIPEDLTGTVLLLGHNQSGHNGYQRTYAAIKCSLERDKKTHSGSLQNFCYVTCAKQKVKKTQFEKQIFEPGVQPMEFMCIDLISEFHPPSSKGNRYTLTAVCMLTGFTFCIPIKNKSPQEVVTAWRNHISFPFGVCRKLLTDNGIEFRVGAPKLKWPYFQNAHLKMFQYFVGIILTVSVLTSMKRTSSKTGGCQVMSHYSE